MRDACCKFLLSQLDPSNCLGIRGFADTHSCSDLLKSAHKYVLQHFVEVSKTEEFMLLPLKQVGARKSPEIACYKIFLTERLDVAALGSPLANELHWNCTFGAL